jgi:Raf kinase inhibitor-like YbhB/YbcL family protein
MKKIMVIICLMAISSFAQAKDMRVQSSSWKDGEPIHDEYVFNGMGCPGQNISPEVSWDNLPKDTKSIAITIHDPDAPTGSGWWHWIVYNIPASVKSFSQGEGKSAEAKLPNGAVQNTTDFGTSGYGGPCPPQGDAYHHYNLTVFALNVDKLDIPANATGAMAGYYINQHMIGKATLTGLYKRSAVKDEVPTKK